MKDDKLAIEGGRKAAGGVGPFPSKIGKDELLEVLDLWEMSPKTASGIKALLQNDAYVRGPHLFRYYNPRPSKVAAAEAAMKKFIGTEYFMATNSGTSGLVAAYRALGIGMGDEVIVPAYTFFATAATVVACNAIPVIVDVDRTLCMDAQAVEKAITKRTKAIAPVHMRGAPAQMDAIMDVARKHGIPVVEDVAQAAGGAFGGKMLGSIGTVGCFSFQHYKIIVSGEGGFLTTNDKKLYTRALNWHDCAACWRPDRFGPEQEGEDLFCGENYRMSELQGAVALAQIRRAGDILSKHRAAKKKIKDAMEEFPGLSFRKIADPDGDTGICLIFFLPDVETTRRALAALKAEGVPCGGIYDSKVRDWHIYAYWEHILQYKSVAADGLPWSGVGASELPKYAKDMCPVSLELLSRAVMVDIDYNMQNGDCAAVANAINKVLRVYLK
jgi:8-amino-3,8-dideoxy-alpha-D-manno-octulosonate transaminase